MELHVDRCLDFAWDSFGAEAVAACIKSGGEEVEVVEVVETCVVASFDNSRSSWMKLLSPVVVSRLEMTLPFLKRTSLAYQNGSAAAVVIKSVQ